MVATQLHESHQGAVRTKQRARLTVYWPGIDNDIDNIVLACKHCQDLLPSHPREPITFKPKLCRPFQEIAGDFCSYAGQDYLILVNCFSDWPDIIPMGHNTTTPCLIAVLKQSFATLEYQTRSGPIKAHNLLLSHFRTLLKHGDFSISHRHPRTHRVMGKSKQLKSIKKLIQSSWTGRYLDDDTHTSSPPV